MPTKVPKTQKEKAYLNWGRWVVDCPATGCNGGILAPLGTDEATCPDCGRVVHYTHPPKKDVEAAERVLGHRIEIENHNWDPRVGETITDLKTENVVRGVKF